MRLALLLVLIWANGLSAETISGKIVKIADGDTLTILDSGKRERQVTLSEIDAPERGQAFGAQSRQSLSSLCFKKSAQVEWRERDRNRHYLGRVTCAGVDANAEQVRRGMAWVSPRSTQPDSFLFDLEAYARLRGIGLWRDASPIAPWEWRATRGKR
jgi:endonuclease YncB( thermonuclease family)